MFWVGEGVADIATGVGRGRARHFTDLCCVLEWLRGSHATAFLGNQELEKLKFDLFEVLKLLVPHLVNSTWSNLNLNKILIFLSGIRVSRGPCCRV